MDRQTKIDQVMKRFAAAWEQGDVDPTPYLEMVSEHERGDLEEQMDLFLMTTPPRRWDPDGFAMSRAERITERVFEAARCPSGDWPELIPALMHENRLKREQVVADLAGELGADTPDEVEQVGEYFHRMTWGTLESSGVSNRVIDALGKILRTSGEALRDAGRAIGRKVPGGEGEGLVYARTPTDPGQTVAYGVPSGFDSEPHRGSERIDRLFTGGPSAGAGD